MFFPVPCIKVVRTELRAGALCIFLPTSVTWEQASSLSNPWRISYLHFLITQIHSILQEVDFLDPHYFTFWTDFFLQQVRFCGSPDGKGMGSGVPPTGWQLADAWLQHVEASHAKNTGESGEVVGSPVLES